MSRATPFVFGHFLDRRLPEMVPKPMVWRGRSLKKSKKRQAIALAALGGCGGLGQLWEALAGPWEALGQLWEGLEELWESSGRLHTKTNSRSTTPADVML